MMFRVPNYDFTRCNRVIVEVELVRFVMQYTSIEDMYLTK